MQRQAGAGNSCTAPLPPRVQSMPFDAGLASVALAGCIGTVLLGCRALWMYSHLRSRRTLSAAKAAADASVMRDPDVVAWHQQRLRTLRACSNLFNDAILFSIAVCVVWALCETYFTVVALVRHSRHASSAEVTWNPYYLTLNECRVSAVVQQYFVISYTVIATVYCAGLAFRPISRQWLYFAAQCSGTVSTIGLWYGSELNKAEHGALYFAPGMPWCWFADGGGTEYNILKFICAFLFYAVFLVFGFIAFWSIRGRLKNQAHARQITHLRLLPQLFVFALIILCGGALRFVIPAADVKAHSLSFKLMAVGFVFAVSFHGALSSAAWAYGEGLLPALVMPWCYSTMNLTQYDAPFSSIMMQRLSENERTAQGIDPLMANNRKESAPTESGAHVRGGSEDVVYRQRLTTVDDDSSR